MIATCTPPKPNEALSRYRMHSMPCFAEGKQHVNSGDLITVTMDEHAEAAFEFT